MPLKSLTAIPMHRIYRDLCRDYASGLIHSKTDRNNPQRVGFYTEIAGALISSLFQANQP
jgi:hypothetical protein